MTILLSRQLLIIAIMRMYNIGYLISHYVLFGYNFSDVQTCGASVISYVHKMLYKLELNTVLTK